MLVKFNIEKIVFYLFLLFTFLFLSQFVSQQYQRKIVIPNRTDRVNLHTAILHKTANSPYRYRILYPALTGMILHSPIKPNFLNIDSLGSGFNSKNYTTEEKNLIEAWYFLDTLSFFLSFLLIYLFLRNLGIIYGLLSTFIMVFAFNAVLIGHAYQPWSIFEAFIFPAAFLLARKIGLKKDLKYLLIYCVISVVAVLNRETGIFISLFIFLQFLCEKKVLKYKLFSFTPLIISGMILLFLHILRGNANPEITLVQIFHANLQGANLYLFKYEAFNFLNFFWIIAILGIFKFSTKLLKYNLMILLYIPFYLIFGIWAEMRLWIPFLSIFILNGFSVIKYFENKKELVKILKQY